MSVRRPSIGVRSSLKSPEWTIDADLGVKGQRVGARHRVGNGNELDLEGSDASALAVGDLDEREVVGDLRLGQSVPRKAQRQAASRRWGR